MSKRKQIITIGSVAIAAIFAVIYFFAVVPYNDQIDQINEDALSQEDTNTNLIIKNERLRKMIELVPEAEKYDENLMKKFPATSEADILRSSILDVAANNSIKEITVSIEVPSLIAMEEPAPDTTADDGMDEGEGNEDSDMGEADPNGGLPDEMNAIPTSQIAYQGLSITGQGSASNIAKFLSGLEGMERSIIITNFSASGSNEGDSSFSIAASSYLHAGLPTEEDAAEGNDEPGIPGQGTEADVLPENF